MKTSNRLHIIIDTNVLLVIFPKKSGYHWVFQKFRNKDFDISITNEILDEYEEKFSEIFDSSVAKDMIESLLTASNVFLRIPYYHWNLLETDPDDNKFIDCAIASNADYIITNDKHFRILKNIEFPKVNILSLKEFIKLIE